MKMLALLAVLISTASADTGLSYLGLCAPSWPCQASLVPFKQEIVFGYLAHTFGDRCTCLDTILKDPRPKTVRVHLTNGPCLRNQRCGKYEVFANLTVAKANRLVIRKDKKLLKQFADVAKRESEKLANSAASIKSCYVSPCLECDLSDEARQILFDIAARYFSNCNYVDSVHNRRCNKRYICEKHGANPKLTSPCISDLDGTRLQDIDLKQYLLNTQKCDIQYLWDEPFNCISGDFTDPRNRNCAQFKSYFRRFRL